ncbi:hypothetical protein F0L17_24105 [Streptomyces sp. TRM43335]|uniref:DUF3040 domain-containing protein n=1 Tax=Streptomyces taklimakanensis TaxID=2569853 RepID=A0A6G2BIL0_9ACTN|nr:hypothetical protein [Streptomyces taklimakanensis]MTE22127.1 hypothetical protein [Streptomyces taklimakanensis]
MKESRLTLRELRILHETERALLRDARLAEAFREFREIREAREAREPDGSGPEAGPGTGPASPDSPASHRLWLLVGICAFLVPALMVLHPGVGALAFLSVSIVCAAGWVSHRRGRRGAG